MPHGLVTLAPPERPLDRALLDAPGGFAWWYVDLVGPERSGLVLIWSFGLPFLPGYLDAARRGRPERAGDRPALNVVVYEAGRPRVYLLEEHPHGDAEWSPDGRRFRFGRSRLETCIEGDRRIVRATLDCAIPGTTDRLRGSVEIEGPARRSDGPEPRVVDPRLHDWSPLTAVAHGRASLAIADRRFEIAGRAYHDRNGSRTPFDQLGIAEWVWGRAALPDRELVWYLLWPAAKPRATFVGVEIERDGRTRVLSDLEVRVRGEERARFGMRWWRELELSQAGRRWLRVEQERPLDDGPFYLRSFVRATTSDGTVADGTGEACVPSRVDRALERPFVRMRVHRPGRGSSRWAPLFLGDRQDRAERLLRSLVGLG